MEQDSLVVKAPNTWSTASTLMLISGLLNAVTGMVWVLCTIWFCVGIIWFVPVGMGAWQAWIGYQMMSKPDKNAKVAAIVGMTAGVFNLNPFPTILALVAFLNVGKPECVAYLEGGEVSGSPM